MTCGVTRLSNKGLRVDGGNKYLADIVARAVEQHQHFVASNSACTKVTVSTVEVAGGAERVLPVLGTVHEMVMGRDDVAGQDTCTTHEQTTDALYLTNLTLNEVRLRPCAKGNNGFPALTDYTSKL